MSIIKKLSNKWGTTISDIMIDNPYPTKKDQSEVIGLGLQIVLGSLIKIGLLIILGLIFNILFPAFIIMITFASFRTIGGGFHEKSYSRCLVVSMILFLVAAILVQNYYNSIPIMMLFVFTTITTLYITIRYVPRDTPNKRITKESEIQKFKRWAIIYWGVWATTMLISLAINLKLFITASCMGLLLELFSISQLGYNFFERIESNNVKSNQK